MSSSPDTADEHGSVGAKKIQIPVKQPLSSVCDIDLS
jgi:hypothetical protein